MEWSGVEWICKTWSGFVKGGFVKHGFVKGGFVNIDNSSHLARKYARIFVRGHYLFREANSLKTKL